MIKLIELIGRSRIFVVLSYGVHFWRNSPVVSCVFIFLVVNELGDELLFANLEAKASLSFSTSTVSVSDYLPFLNIKYTTYNKIWKRNGEDD